MSEAHHMAPNDDEKQLLDSPRESRWQGVFFGFAIHHDSKLLENSSWEPCD